MSLSLITNAIADTTTSGASPASGGNMASILLLLGFVVVFYFLLWRPQAKRAKDHRNLVSNLSKGDEVITSGGIYGKIADMTDDYLVLAIADNVQIKAQKSAISSVLPKGTIK